MYLDYELNKQRHQQFLREVEADRLTSPRANPWQMIATNLASLVKKAEPKTDTAQSIYHLSVEQPRVMMNLQDYELNRARREDIQREAENQRLAYRTQTTPVRHSALVTVGRQMVKLGERLQQA